jgi:hypothetical protein
VTSAAEAHAREILDAAFADARSTVGDAISDVRRIRARIEQLAEEAANLLRDVRREADRLTAELALDAYPSGRSGIERPRTAESEVRLESGGPKPEVAVHDFESFQPGGNGAESVATEPPVSSTFETEIIDADLEEAQADREEEFGSVPVDATVVDDVTPAVPASPEPEESEAAPAATPCDSCDASGKCSRCNGSGKRLIFRCSRCGGSGCCPVCGGPGFIWAA